MPPKPRVYFSGAMYHAEPVKKLVSSTFVLKGQVDFQSFRMRSLRLGVTRHGNKDAWLSQLTTQCFNLQRLRSKASPIHPSFPFEPCARFFHTFAILCGNAGRTNFFDGKDRTRFFLLLQEGAERFGHRIHVLCLMSDSLRLAIQTAKTSLSRMVENLSFPYTGTKEGP
jgi:hypothetical protein